MGVSRRRLLLSAALTLLPLPLVVQAAARLPEVVAVPSRPAFVQPPGRREALATVGLNLKPESLLRTQAPGRMQVRLADGRSFRLGGDALLRLGRDLLDLKRGQIIAWVDPLQKGGLRLRVRTRVATASIEGTTVFLDVNDTQVKVFSWEGHVQLTTSEGQRFDLHGGDEVQFQNGRWQPLRRLSRVEARERLQRSILLNDFPAPMETLPLIRRTLELETTPPVSPPAGPPRPPAGG